MLKKSLSLLLALALLLGSSALAQEEQVPDLSMYAIPFDTTDLNGERVTAQILENYDLTIVNVWAVTCGYCVREMPGLEEFYQQLPENVNMIGLCLDADSYGDVAKKIIDQSKVTFTNVLLDQALYASLYAQITGTPTTFYLDNKGNIVGKPLVGAVLSNAVEVLNGELNTRLALLNKDKAM